MSVFTYTALDAHERSLGGTLAADSAVDARQQLRDRGLRIMSFAPALPESKRRSRITIRWPGSARRRAEHVAEVARHLSMLLRADVPLTDGLDVLSKQCHTSLTGVLVDIRDRVGGGSSLAEALEAHDRWFDSLFVSAVRTGELSGMLDECLTELANHLESQQSMRGRLTAALTYPMIVAMVAVLVVVFLMTFVVPQLLTAIEASGRPLPTSTLIVKTLSDTLITHWFTLAVAVMVSVAAASLAWRHRTMRITIECACLGAPLVGTLLRKAMVARFAQQSALLLNAGVPFVEAMRHVSGNSRSVVLSDELAALASAVESGSDIAPAVAGSRVFPPMVIHLLAVGQDAGELTAMLSELRTRYETEVRVAADRFTAALEPILIVLLAAGVGFVVFACLMPILEATRAIA